MVVMSLGIFHGSMIDSFEEFFFFLMDRNNLIRNRG